MELAPQELLPTMPPIMARLAVEVSGVKNRPCGWSARLSSLRTTPGCTRTRRLGGVDRDDAVQVAADVDHDAGADHLAGERGAGGARDEAEVVAVRETRRVRPDRPRCAGRATAAGISWYSEASVA